VSFNCTVAYVLKSSIALSNSDLVAKEASSLIEAANKYVAEAVRFAAELAFKSFQTRSFPRFTAKYIDHIIDTQTIIFAWNSTNLFKRLVLNKKDNGISAAFGCCKRIK
jgi:hypothetical protein